MNELEKMINGFEYNEKNKKIIIAYINYIL